jgi:hypothetical protein
MIVKREILNLQTAITKLKETICKMEGQLSVFMEIDKFGIETIGEDQPPPKIILDDDI